MLSYYRVTDPERIRRVLSLDNIWEDMKEDDSEDTVVVNDTLWYLPVFTGKNLAGIAIAQWLGNRHISWHFGLLKRYRGKDSPQYAKHVLDDISGVVHTTMIPEYKENALKYAKQLGFKVVYTFKDAVERDGELFNKILLQKD